MRKKSTDVGAAVRENADGSLSLRPGVDCRAPGHTLPPAPAVPERESAPYTPGIEVREVRIPEFLLKRLPSVFHMEPAGRA